MGFVFTSGETAENIIELLEGAIQRLKGKGFQVTRD